ncbi:PASTA domain-containing protein [Nocardioides sp. SR21]|uniref:PASTA domain-containing protein n=1 Tax=Nocardioides sp. SR21 TaxID=2919501 RepID=UPI001FAA4BD1|nr:PASTA domain-containing protein [Nocardioides sp. SR21]
MLTDDDARLLLHRAGQSIEVDPAPPLIDVPPRRHAWPALAAAAAVVLIAALAVVADRASSNPEPAPAPEKVSIPSVLGYGLDAAERALLDAGVTTRVESTPMCKRNYVLGTEPAAGTPVAPGSEVVVRHATPGPGFCIADEDAMLGLLAFADGRGPVPRLAQIVTLYDGSGNQVALTADQAADANRWRVCAADESCISILDELVAAAHRPYPIGAAGTTHHQSPMLTAVPDPACTFETGVRGFGAPDAQIGVQLPTDGVFCTQEFVVSVHRNADWLIEAVGLRERVGGSPTG